MTQNSQRTKGITINPNQLTTIKEHNNETFIIEEKFTGYANIRIEAETEEEAIALYNRGYYKDSNYIIDDMTYDHEFFEIREETDENN